MKERLNTEVFEEEENYTERRMTNGISNKLNNYYIRDSMTCTSCEQCGADNSHVPQVHTGG